MPYFVGLADYPMEAPLAPSLWVEIRKRMGTDVFEAFHGAIIAAVEKAKRQPAPGRRPESGQDEAQQPEPERNEDELSSTAVSPV